jgi:HEAT repeat protein
MVLSATLFLAVDAPKAKPAKEEPLSFEQLAFPLDLPYYLDFRVAFGLDCYSSISEPQLRSFPNKLVQALQGNKTKDREIALGFLNTLAAMVKQAAWDEGRDDSSAQFRLALAPYTPAIVRCLKLGLTDPKVKNRFLAAAALLVLEPNHQGALTTVIQCLNNKDPAKRAGFCEAVGPLHLDHSEIITSLSKSLRASDGSVRRAAARAVAEIGPSAKATVPALIELLASKEAVGEFQLYFTMSLPRETNLAVLALSAIGPDAAPAVPTLVKLLAKTQADECWDLICCLGAIGQGAREAGPALRRLLQPPKNGSKDLVPEKAPFPFWGSPNTRLGAAAALLRIFPGDTQAINFLKTALKGPRAEIRRQAAEVCFLMRVKEKALIGEFIALVEHKDEDVATAGALALSKYGPAAATAVPALEKMLMKESSSFTTGRAAAHCLSKIGKAGLPALIRAANKKDSMGKDYAVLALGSFPQDANLVVPELNKALVNEVTRHSAIIAVGRLGKAARPASFSLFLTWLHAQWTSDNPEIALLANWALMQICEWDKK